jgi:apolipoprotein N-acyltransferase
VRLRLVQPAIEQNLHSDPARTEREFLGTVALTRSAGFEGRTVVIWPESGVPYELSNNQPLRQGLAAQVVPADGLFMSGGVRTAGARTPNFQVWNTLYALDARGEIRGLFDKFHLVPFGEYMPLRSIVSLAKITAGNVDFSTGPGNVTLDLPGLPRVSPLICYEIIFPGAVVDGGDRPGWIVNVTNDAWFGITSGPYQHFAAARLRAVEEGLPVVRSANNGVSGVIDAYGRVTRVLDLGLRGVIDADLPVALPPTLYGRLGDWAVLILGIATVLVLIPLMAKRVRLTH